MADIKHVLARLSRSPFRQRFALSDADRTYLASKGLDTVLDHARGFIEKRLAPANPARDGKQTPFRGHPVFVAQHATATCCRECLAKWHDVPRNQALDSATQAYILSVIELWLRQHGGDLSGPAEPRLL